MPLGVLAVLSLLSVYLLVARSHSEMRSAGKMACGVFLLATFALGIVDTAFSCNSLITSVYESTQTIGIMVGFMYQGFPVGITASILSLTTNLLATLLVAYKAWESRTCLRGYLVAGPRTAQVKKLFVLIESGAIYSAFWTANPEYQEGFFNIVGVIMNGTLVLLIAIYPTIIIILVELNRSHMERGLLRHAQSLSLPSLPVTFETCTTSHHGTRSTQSVTGMASMNDGRFRCGDGLGDARGPTSEERKVEGII
ncbi:hypothetical protein V8D89_000089 [Ganoderma adspersum]